MKNNKAPLSLVMSSQSQVNRASSHKPKFALWYEKHSVDGMLLPKPLCYEQINTEESNINEPL